MAINGISTLLYYPVIGNGDYKPVVSDRKPIYTTPQVQQREDDEDQKQYVGSAKTEIAKKGLKYIWQSLKKFVSKIFRADEEAQKTIADTINAIDKINTISDYFDKEDNVK